ncbi:MAG: fibronectin type III domain-containing protein, partial [Firmicutes bacterium]|nr:fibronectin type III domain-containing protein [Bacillota bacterium]
NELYIYGYDEDEDEYVWKQQDGNKIIEEVGQDSDQLDTPWDGTPGAENTFYAVYLGAKSDDLTVKIGRSMSHVKVNLAKNKYVYDGKVKTPAIKSVTDGKTALVKDKDYEVTYTDSGTAVGDYWIGLHGLGTYAGWTDTYMQILPKGATISKPKAAKKAITVKWKKQAAKMTFEGSDKAMRITGYQVQYSLKKNFKSAKTKNVKGYKKTSLKIKKLKKKKNYYVRVRTYTNYDGWTYYSDWSKVKKVKTK